MVESTYMLAVDHSYIWAILPAVNVDAARTVLYDIPVIH
jgi:hypothetical protein